MTPSLGTRSRCGSQDSSIAQQYFANGVPKDTGPKAQLGASQQAYLLGDGDSRPLHDPFKVCQRIHRDSLHAASPGIRCMTMHGRQPLCSVQPWPTAAAHSTSFCPRPDPTETGWYKINLRDCRTASTLPRQCHQLDQAWKQVPDRALAAIVRDSNPHGRSRRTAPNQGLLHSNSRG